MIEGMKKQKIIIMSNQGPALTRLFSATVIKELASSGWSGLGVKILKDAGLSGVFDPSTTLRSFFDTIYDALFHSYRSEYIYKNVIAQKILLGIHSLNTSFMLTEFRSALCRADVVLLNGTSTVYEIKSAYDSMGRLSRQLQAYRQLFDKVCVITAPSQVENVKQHIADDVGLLVLSDRNTLTTIQEPSSMKNSVVPSAIFDSLRRKEYEEIVRMRFGAVPDVPNTRIYQACHDLFCTLDPVDAHDSMVLVLKKRGGSKRLNEFIESVPSSLKAASLSCKLSAKEQSRFSLLLNSVIGDCLSIC
ncbi:hypothetical protein C2E25_01930 [Geothermobacter hydrogeniphilus]|uniref:Sce7726 family protein n=1 Tax=Geothermobacter hydrogeniphilus TaxID=1969733 RepID=A0A2K2HEC1_9BACT|nr:sce7726 family protein [Geothermobacter hydrogeniphilus]PNU21644.1 hypothetical protein C2E25_01930 [Geothermobacter hydrogeniphilus]